jgi:hypothetical protein
MTPPFKKKLPHGLILYQKGIWVKLKKEIIVCGKVMNRNKILCSLRNMKNITGVGKP